MLTKVTITDNANTPLSYIPNLWDNGKEWYFKPGINIIIGENGCGKSTLLKLIATYGLCQNSMVSALPNLNAPFEVLKIQSLFKDNNLLGEDDATLRDGCIVNMDYQGVVFRYLPAAEHKDGASIDDIDAFTLALEKNSSSTGESMTDALAMLIQRMNSEKNINFPIADLHRYIEGSNDVWNKRLSLLLNYYHANRINVSQEDYEFTVLMDEPDRNLDIDHIKQLFNILSYHRPQTQIIAVIHNPVLIYKLSKAKGINIIEMTPGYRKDVQKFVEWSHGGTPTP